MRKLKWLRAEMLILIILALVLAIGATTTWAGQFDSYDAKIKALKAKEKAIGDYQAKVRAQGAQAKSETVMYDGKEKAAAAGAAQARKVKLDATAKQDKICKVVGFVPVLGLGMRQYNAGEMRACRQDIADFKAGKKGCPVKPTAA